MRFILQFTLLVTFTIQVRGDINEELRSLLDKALEDHLPRRHQRRNVRQVKSADPGALMYLPIGGAGNVRCPTAADSAAVSIAQMTFLATAMNILSIVANINNNINNNNNNNNQLNINAQSNNNVVSNTNVNNGNQVNVMVPVLNP